MLALAGCAGGQAYTGVEAGPQAAVDPMPQVVPAQAPLPKPDNPLLADWVGPYGGVPAWDRYNPSQFGEAFAYAIEVQRRETAEIVDNPEPPTFENTIVALEKSGDLLGQVQTVYGVYQNNMLTPEFRDKFSLNEWRERGTKTSPRRSAPTLRISKRCALLCCPPSRTESKHRSR